MIKYTKKPALAGFLSCFRETVSVHPDAFSRLNPNNFVPLIFARRSYSRVIMGIIFACRKKELEVVMGNYFR